MRAPRSAASAAEREAVLAVKEILEQAAVNETVPHDVLKAAIRQHVADAAYFQYYNIIGRAKTILNEEMGAVFGTINSVGYKKLSSGVGVDYAGKRPLDRIRRLTRRSVKTLFNAFRHANDLSQSERRQALQRASTLQLIGHLTMAKTVATMPDEPAPASDPLKPLRDALGV